MPEEGSIWERTTHKPRHESHVRVLRALKGSRGLRYLVEGLTSGRQWTVSHITLLSSYQPNP